MVQCPNRQAMCKTGAVGATGPLGNDKFVASLDPDKEPNLKKQVIII